MHKLPDNLEVYRSGLMIGCGRNIKKCDKKGLGYYVYQVVHEGWIGHMSKLTVHHAANYAFSF